MATPICLRRSASSFTRITIPAYISGSLLPYVYPPGSPRQETSTDTTFLLAWQGGFNYHFTENISAKAAATLYNYIGLMTNQIMANYSGGIGDTFIGEGAYGGTNSTAPVNGLTSENGIVLQPGRSQ